jgi:hypothetical protein
VKKQRRAQAADLLYIVCGPDVIYEEDLDRFRVAPGTSLIVATREWEVAEETVEGYIETLSEQYSLDDMLPQDVRGVRSMEDLVEKHTTITEVRVTPDAEHLFVVTGPRGVRREGLEVVLDRSSVWGVCEREDILGVIRRECDKRVEELAALETDSESVEWEKRGLGSQISVEHLTIAEHGRDEEGPRDRAAP